MVYDGSSGAGDCVQTLRNTSPAFVLGEVALKLFLSEADFFLCVYFKEVGFLFLQSKNGLSEK